MKPGEKLALLFLEEKIFEVKRLSTTIIGQISGDSTKEANFRRASRFVNTNLPEPKESHYSEEGITEETLETELKFEEVDNEARFFERLEKQFPKVAAELRKFLNLKLPEAVYRFEKCVGYTFVGQYQGTKPKGIGALIFDYNNFSVGQFEGKRLNGQGREFFDYHVEEGIYKNGTLVESRKLNLESVICFDERHEAGREKLIA